MKRLVLILMLMVPMVVLAQQTTVGGTVIDEKTGRPLSQVSVSVGRISVVTNEDGAFTLKLAEMPRNLTVSHLGYKTKRVKVSERNNDVMKIMLTPAAIPSGILCMAIAITKRSIWFSVLLLRCSS